MTQVELLNKQTEDAHYWTNQLIQSIPFENWEDTPDVIESNVSWQVGHLIMSHYFHSILTIKGHHGEIVEQIPLRKYSALYAFDELPRRTVGQIEPEILIKHLNLVQQKSIETISALSEQDLLSALEPTRVPHPIAKNKFEALSWNIKHTMWHCGQLG